MARCSGGSKSTHKWASLLSVPMEPAALQATSEMAPSAPTTQSFVAHEPPKFTGYGDLQSPEEFIDPLDSFCLLNGITSEDRLPRVVPAALESSAKLWFRFTEKFAYWQAFVTASRREFVPIDFKKRLKEELTVLTQHPEENLKQFIYANAEYYERLGAKVNQVLRQMYPQFQALAEGRTFTNLEELAQAADGLMETACLTQPNT